MMDHGIVWMGTVETVPLADRDAWTALRASGLFAQREAVADRVLRHPLPSDVPGYCSGCGDWQTLRFDARGGRILADGSLSLALSETGACNSCALSSRVRFACDVVEAEGLGRGAGIYITEACTPLHLALQRRFDKVLASEFQPDPAMEGVLREDVHNLSFADRALDCVLCLDVLEHVDDPFRAIAEIHRVLKPGGIAVVAFPFFAGKPQSLRRATFGADGQLEHFLEPQYHGGPRGSRSLVFNDIGWDFVARCKGAMGRDFNFVNYWSAYNGHFGDRRFACLLRKAGKD